MTLNTAKNFNLVEVTIFIISVLWYLSYQSWEGHNINPFFLSYVFQATGVSKAHTWGQMLLICQKVLPGGQTLVVL